MKLVSAAIIDPSWWHPSDKDAHNPFLMHITPSEMTWKEKREYVPGELKQARKQRRKEKQRDNKRKAYQAEEEDEDDGPWINFTTQEWLDYQPEHRRQQRSGGYGHSSASSSWQWRPKNR